MSVVSEKIIADLRFTIESLEADHVKFKNGNSAAGTRVRNYAQTIKVLAQELRIDIQKSKNKI